MTLHFKNESELKPVLGAYAAMARNNAFLTVMDIMDQLHLYQQDIFDKEGKKQDLESHIWKLNLFPENHLLLPEQKKRATQLLCSHFPFLNLVANTHSTGKNGNAHNKTESYEEFCKHFLSMIEVLTHLRDSNLHYKIKDDKVLDRNYRKNEYYTGHILRDILKEAPGMIKDRYKGTSLLDEKSLDFFFNHRWAFNPQRKPLPSEKIQKFDRLSLFGEILLISLFVEKRYIPVFLHDCGLEDNFDATAREGKISQQRVMREIISAYSIRIPERKLDISMNATQAKLDMLNELARCPSELYEVMPEREKSSFEIISSDGTPVHMKRYSDRYVPLILRYIDTTEEFGKLRFQVNTGLFRYELHGEKEYMDGASRVRIVQKGINGFGRIQEMEENRKKEDAYLGYPLHKTDDNGNATEMPYITDSATRYVLNGELIGLSVNGDIHPVIELLNNGNDSRYKVRSPQPDCWLSRFDLPALAFYTFLSKKYDIRRSAEDIIIDTEREYRTFFSDVAEGRIKSLSETSIPAKNIPEKLVGYLSGSVESFDFKRFKEGVIVKMISETEYRLTRLDEDLKATASKQNRIGKKSFVRILPGKLAEFLAQDIVRFQGYPSGHPEAKLTGQQYSILQGMIAMFHEDLPKACQKAGLLDGESAHPFLSRLFSIHGKKMSTTVDFYRAYLEERLSYLKGGVPDNAPFLHAGRKKWSSQKDNDCYKELASRYVKDEKTGEKVGIFLPRDLFDKPVLEIIRHHCPQTADIINKSLKKTGRANMSFIILTYLKNELEDRNQGFYFNEERLQEYGFCRLVQKEITENGFRRLSTILRQEKDSNPCGLYFQELKRTSNWKEDGHKADPLSRELEELAGKLRKAYKRMCENEKAIRRYMVQDITMFLLARNLIHGTSDAINLRSVGPQGKGILDQIVDVETHFKNVIIRQSGISIKDYGEIYKVLKDKRINSLLNNQSKRGSDIIDFNDIKEELTIYNHKRVPIIKSIQEYEKGVFDTHQEYFDRLSTRFGFKEVLEVDQHSSPLIKEALRNVRNAISHNTYPNRIIKKDSHQMELYPPALPLMAKEVAETTKRLTKYGPELNE